MPHPLIATAMIAALIAALLVWRQIVIAVVDAYGTPSGAIIIVACYALACYFHRRECGY